MTALGEINSQTEVNVADDGDTTVITNSVNANDCLAIERTFVGAGNGAFIDMGPGGEAVTGHGVDVAMGSGSSGHALRAILAAGASGDGLHVEDSGSGPAIYANKIGGVGSLLQLEVGGSPVMMMAASGQLSFLLPTGEAADLVTTTGDATLQSTASGIEVAGDVNLFSEATAIGATAGNLRVTSEGNAGTQGSVTIGSFSTFASAPAGSVSIQAEDTAIFIGTITATTTTIGDAGTGACATITHAEVSGSPGDPCVVLNAARTTGGAGAAATAVGAYAIGVNAEAFSTISPATPDLQTTLVALDAAIGGGGSLQTAYDAGRTISIGSVTETLAVVIANNTNGNGNLRLENSTGQAGTMLYVDTGAGSTGAAALIFPRNTSAGVSINGSGLQAATSTSDALEIQWEGHGNAINVFHNGSSDAAATQAVVFIEFDGSGNSDSTTALDIRSDAEANNLINLNWAPPSATSAGHAIQLTADPTSYSGGSGTGANPLIRIEDGVATVKHLLFDHTGFFVSENSSFTYAFTAADMGTLSTPGIGYSMTAGEGGGSPGGGGPGAMGGAVTVTAGQGGAAVAGGAGGGGGVINIIAGAGAAGVDSGAGIGGAALVQGGAGGAAGTSSANDGGSASVQGGTGGAATGAVAAGNGGPAGAVGGTGGAGTATGAAGDGGNINIEGGLAGTDGGGGGGDGGDVLINGGNASGGGTDGSVTIGATNTDSVSIASGSNSLGFHGATPVTQQTITGSRGGNAALADLLTKLATLGLIIDGTSA